MLAAVMFAAGLAAAPDPWAAEAYCSAVLDVASHPLKMGSDFEALAGRVHDHVPGADQAMAEYLKASADPVLVAASRRRMQQALNLAGPDHQRQNAVYMFLNRLSPILAEARVKSPGDFEAAIKGCAEA